MLYPMEQNTFLKIIGGKIRAIRKSKNISQERLAELSGLHPTYISDVERGKVNASIYSCFVITKALGVSFADVVSSYADEKNKEMENEVAVVIGLIKELDRKKQKIILSAIKGMVSAIEKI